MRKEIRVEESKYLQDNALMAYKQKVKILHGTYFYKLMNYQD